MMNNNIKISGYSIKKVLSILEFIIIQFRKKSNNEIFHTLRLIKGEYIYLPKNKVIDKGTFNRIDCFLNYTDKENNPIPISPIYEGETYYADYYCIDVDKKTEIELTTSSQKVIKKLYIKANTNIYFEVKSVANYSFNIVKDSNKDDHYLVNINGMVCDPGQTSDVNTYIVFYKLENEIKEIIAECPINIRVYHETMGNSD